MRFTAWQSKAALLVAFGFALCEAEGARAAPISISPVTVTLTPPARVAQITIRNPSEEPLRLQVSAFAWTDAADGSVKLAPAHDIIVFPQLVTIPLFGKQQIRAAILSPPGAVEKTYRIVLDPLPPPNSGERLSGPGIQLNIRTRFTIPIFQEPAVPRPSGQIASATIRHGTVAFAIVNSGNMHLGGDPIRIIGRDGAGRVVFSQPFWDWYVLINNRRAFSFHLPQDGCRDVRSVTIAPPPEMKVPAKKIEVESGACGA